MGDVGGCAAHVEADEEVVALRIGRANHADDAAGGAGEDGVAALEEHGVGQAAVRLHEEEAVGGAALDVEGGGDAVDVAAQDRGEVGVDDGGVAAADELDEARGLVAGGDLGEADLAGDLGHALLVPGLAVGMHEGDGDGAEAFGVGLLEGGAGGVLVERGDDLTARV